MNYKVAVFFVLVLLLDARFRCNLEAQDNYESPWVADSRYEKISFKFKRKKGDYWYYYKNSSEKDWRVSVQISGAGYGEGNVDTWDDYFVLKANRQKGGGRMYLSGPSGSQLTSRIVKIEEVTDLGRFKDDFQYLKKELGAGNYKKLDKDAIRRLLDDEDTQNKIRELAKLSKRKENTMLQNAGNSKSVSSKMSNESRPFDRTDQKQRKIANKEKKSKKYYEAQFTGIFFRLFDDGRAETTTYSFKQRYVGTWKRDGGQIQIELTQRGDPSKKLKFESYQVYNPGSASLTYTGTLEYQGKRTERASLWFKTDLREK